jgi:hypothetical protein
MNTSNTPNIKTLIQNFIIEYFLKNNMLKYKLKNFIYINSKHKLNKKKIKFLN